MTVHFLPSSVLPAPANESAPERYPVGFSVLVILAVTIAGWTVIALSFAPLIRFGSAFLNIEIPTISFELR